MESKSLQDNAGRKPPPVANASPTNAPSDNGDAPLVNSKEIPIDGNNFPSIDDLDIKGNIIRYRDELSSPQHEYAER